VLKVLRSKLIQYRLFNILFVVIAVTLEFGGGGKRRYLSVGVVVGLWAHCGHSDRQYFSFVTHHLAFFLL
jgi:hypothetical protein